MCREEGEECEASLAREDIMERSMIYEGFVKSEGVYEGRGEIDQCNVFLFVCFFLNK